MDENKKRKRHNESSSDSLGEQAKPELPIEAGELEYKEPNEIRSDAVVNNDVMIITDRQRKQLIENGLPENSGKNHYPISFIEVKKVGYAILITEINSEDSDLCFGLCDYGGTVRLTTFSISKLKEDVKSENSAFSTNFDFWGKYPIAVYARVAKEIGAVVGYSTDRLLDATFEKYAQEKWSKESLYLNELGPL